MAEESATTDAPQEPVTQLTFNIKASSDAKHIVTVPETMTVLELKNKLSTSEYADVPAERQRLIYSGRVLKDADPLSTYKIKDGNTVHMVKGAVSNQRQNPASQGSSTASPQSTIPPGAGVPQNIATGTGTDPLAGLTGARYAGFAQMPGANQFGPDGGMGPPQGPEEMLRMLENPMFMSQMNEAMNNPHVIQMMQNMPQIRNQPFMRQMLENPQMRRMMLDPEVIRQSMNMQRMYGGGGGLGGGGQASMPAPGVTDTTPQQAGGTGADAPGTSGTNNPTSPPPNPFAMFGMPGQGGAANPFAALFGNPNMGTNTSTNSTTNTSTATPEQSATQPPELSADEQQRQARAAQQLHQTYSDMFGSNMGGMNQNNPMAAMAQQMMQNPEMMRSAAQMMGLGGGLGGTGGDGGQGAFNPFALFGSPQQGQQEQQQQPPQQQQDTRPPEEQYAEQLRQLNEMGFYEFERNVRALRMSGGSVQGAIEVLLSGTI